MVRTVVAMHVDYGARDFSQSGGIYNSYSTVAKDLWQRKPPLSSGCALGLGSVYCHNSLAPCYNYNKVINLGAHDAMPCIIIIFIVKY